VDGFRGLAGWPLKRPEFRFTFKPDSWSEFVLDWNHGMIKVNIQEAKTHLSRYIGRVEKGDVVVVCRHNQPVAELRGIETAPAQAARVAGLLKGRMHWEPDAFAPMSAEELAEFDGAPALPLRG
jgi:prevent-host-death family protein